MMIKGDIRFIAYPSAVHYGVKGEQSHTKGKKAVNHLLWGDYAKILSISGNWIEIRARRKNGWVRKENLQENRILEVNFVDVGQGDGCHIQTPDDRALVVDAGQEDNMYRFLSWRFGRFKSTFPFESFVISHPDQDHYLGFTKFFEKSTVKVETVFHNSIIEQVRGGKSSLGAEKKIGKKKFLSGLVHSMEDLKAITDSQVRSGRKKYPKMLKVAVDNGRVGDIKSIMADQNFDVDVYLPGFSPADNRGMTLKVLGPVPHLDSNKRTLPKLGSTGVTKNGHSVILLLEIGSIKMLLGGDLNKQSQQYLLEHYTGLSSHPKTPNEEKILIDEARKTFEVDVAKACHHGSAHVSPTFLQATNPLATVISSGDNEPHSHPRPDALGMIGRFSRGDRPLIFSTELARSGVEHIKHPNKVRRELKKKIEEVIAIRHSDEATQPQKDKANKQLDKHLEVIQRSVANYGMINVRTDGEKVIITQRLERQRSKSQRWDIYQFETDDRGRLKYVY